MSDPVLRIFSYQPNPRIMKATIAARLCGLEVELRGAAPRDLQHWLWDFDVVVAMLIESWISHNGLSSQWNGRDKCGGDSRCCY